MFKVVPNKVVPNKVVPKETSECAQQPLTEFSQREFALELAQLRFCGPGWPNRVRYAIFW